MRLHSPGHALLAQSGLEPTRAQDALRMHEAKSRMSSVLMARDERDDEFRAEMEQGCAPVGKVPAQLIRAMRTRRDSISAR